MQISLYDSLASLPPDEGNHILVFAGRGSLVRSDVTEMVTEIHCTYHIGGSTVRFLHNGDAANLRFEQAVSWAAKYAETHKIPNVYSVFELDRPVDRDYLEAISPTGIIDRRDGAKTRAAAWSRVDATPCARETRPRRMVLRQRKRRENVGHGAARMRNGRAGRATPPSSTV